MTPEIVENLVKISESLDNKGLSNESLIIDNLSEKIVKLMKSAQYVGSQGYWIANSRCWGNCYRQKRSSKNVNSQKAWEDCLSEYQKAVNDGSFSEWEKYANDSSFKIEKYSGTDMFMKISKSVEEGESLGSSIAVSLENFPSYISESIVRISSDLISLSNSLKNSKHAESEDLIKISSDLIKESQWWKKVQDFAANTGNAFGNIGQGIGQGLGNMVGGFPGSFVGGVQGAYNAGRQKALDDSARSRGFNSYQEMINSQNPNNQSPTIQPSVAAPSVTGPVGNKTQTQNVSNPSQTADPAATQNNTTQQGSQKHIMTTLMLDSILNSYVWPKDTLSHIAKWYNNQIKFNAVAQTPNSMSQAPSSSKSQNTQTQSQPPVASSVNLFGDKGGPKVSKSSKDYWDNLVGDQKKALIKGQFGNSSGSVFTSPIPSDLVNAIKNLDNQARTFLYRTSSKE